MYPIDLRADYGDGIRSRGLAALGAILLKPLVLLPHLIVLAVLGWAAQLIAWIGYWVITFTGELPEFFHTFPLRVLQWQTRATAWLLTIEDAYPPFMWEGVQYGAELTVDEPPGPRSRLFGVLGIVWLKPIAAIPHFIVLIFVLFAAFIASWIGYIVVLFSGKLPQGIFQFAVGSIRWSQRISAWLYSLTDEYPPFRLEP